MKTIISDTLPCWWKLGWSPADNSLKILVAESFISAFPPIPTNSPLILQVKEQISYDLFASFSCDLTAPHFGFNQSIKRVPETKPHESFVTFTANLPQVYCQTGMVCRECGGTGEREPGSYCYSCGGSKVDGVYDWDRAYSVTKSLQLMFWLFDLEVETKMLTQTPQLLRLTLCAERDMHGSSLGGYLSKEGFQTFDHLVHGNTSHVREVEKGITSALKQAWKHMMGNENHVNYNLRAEIREGTSDLFITCPGNAAGVYTTNERRSTHSGCEISCHNMDNPAQALSCIAGLAVFCEELERMWRKQEKKVFV